MEKDGGGRGGGGEGAAEAMRARGPVGGREAESTATRCSS